MRTLRLTRFPALAAALLTATSTALSAQEAFQGAITYRMMSDGRAAEMVMMSLGSKARVEMSGQGMPGPMVILIDGEKMLMQVVMAQMGMYMEMDMNQAMANMPSGAPDAGAAARGTFTRVDGSDEVAGVRCQNYRFSQPGQPESEVCVATGMGYWMGGMSAPRNSRMPIQLGPDFSAFKGDFNEGMLPLRVRTRKGEGWETMMEATLVERRRLGPDLFTVPAGLRKMAMP